MRKVPKLDVEIKNEFLDKLKSGDITLTDEILKSIEWGIEHNSKSITLFNLNISEFNSTVSFSLIRDKWAKLLDDMLRITIEYEQYEQSAKIKKVQDLLK